GGPARAVESASRSRRAAALARPRARRNAAGSPQHTLDRGMTRPARSRHRKGAGRKPCGTPSPGARFHRSHRPRGTLGGCAVSVELAVIRLGALPASLAQHHRPYGRIPPVVIAHNRAAEGKAALAPAASALAPSAVLLLTAHQAFLQIN